MPKNPFDTEQPEVSAVVETETITGAKCPVCESNAANPAFEDFLECDSCKSVYREGTQSIPHVLDTNHVNRAGQNFTQLSKRSEKMPNVKVFISEGGFFIHSTKK